MSAGWRSFARAQADAATTTASDAVRTNRTREFYYYVRMACDRRAFLTTVTAVTGLTALPAAQSADRPPSPPPTEWDLSWLDQLKGKHKQAIDVGNMDVSEDTPLRVPMNYLDAFRDVYHLEPPEVNVVIGIARVAFPINASDAIWEKYQLGERWNIKDPQSGKPATRNIFLGQPTGGPGSTVRALQRRGVVFWQCNVALQAVTGQLARATGKPAADVRADLVAGLNPAVRLVPAHTMMIGLVQERGFTYEKP